MAKKKDIVKFSNVGDLLDELYNRKLEDLMSGYVYAPDGTMYSGFKIKTNKLTDGSVTYDLELVEDE